MRQTQECNIDAIDLLGQGLGVLVTENQIGVMRCQVGIQRGNGRTRLAIAGRRHEIETRMSSDQTHEFNPGVARGPNNGGFLAVDYLARRHSARSYGLMHRNTTILS